MVHFSNAIYIKRSHLTQGLLTHYYEKFGYILVKLIIYVNVFQLHFAIGLSFYR